MVRPESQVALALFAVLVVAAVGMMVLPAADHAAEQHQLPGQGPVAVTVTGTPPTGVAVAANYPVELSAGNVAQLGGPLLRVQAAGIGPGGTVTIQAYPPGTDDTDRTVTIPGGVLLVQGDPAHQLTVTVSTPTGTPLGAPKEVARVSIDAQAGTISLRAKADNQNFLHLTFSRFWTVAYDEDGDAIDVSLVNPLSTVEGRLANRPVAPPGLSPVWLHFRWDQDEVTLDLLRTGVAAVDGKVPARTVIPTDSVAGDPLGSGLVVRADGEEALTLRLGSAPPDIVRTVVGGAVIEDELGGPLVLSLHHYGLLPWDSLLEVWHGNGAYNTVHVLQPSTLRPLFQAAADPASASVSVPPFARSVVLPGGGASVWVRPDSDAVQVMLDGTNVLTAEIRPGGPVGTTPDLVLSGSLLTQLGLGSPTHVTPSYLAGLILGTSGDAQDAAAAVLADNAGNIVAQAETEGEGAYLRVGASKVSVAEGRIVAAGGLPRGARLTLHDGTGAVVAQAVAADLTSTSASPAGGYPVVTASAAGETVTVASPVQLDGPTGAWTGFRVLNPVNSAQALVEHNDEGLWVLGEKVAPPEPDISGVGDPIGDDTFSISAGPATVTIDRRTTPPTITVAGVDAPQVPPSTPETPQTPGPPEVPDPGVNDPDVPDLTTIQVPIVVVGPPTAPTGIIVYDPQHMPDPPPLLALQNLPTGTSVATLPNGETVQLPSNLVHTDGLPLASPQWKLTLRPPGQAPIVVPVDRAAVQAQLYGNGVDIDPFVTVLAGAGPGVNFHKIATDGPRTLDPARLDGASWLNGNGDITVRVDVPKRDDRYQPVLLWAKGALPQRGSSPSALMQPAGGNADYTSYKAKIPAPWLANASSGDTVHFALGFDLNAANLATQSFTDEGDGAGYRFRVDRDGPSPAGASVSVPDASKPTQLRVGWTATDRGSGLASYLVQKQRDTGPWEEWIPGATGTGADFTGEAGHTYRFRARATDKVGNVGGFGAVGNHTIPAPPPPPTPGTPGNQTGGNAENRAPTIKLLAPLGGEVFENVRTVAIRWTAADLDGTTPVVTLWGSGDGGSNWAVIASPEGSEYAWDVSRLSGTDFRVKAAVSDGSLQDADLSARFTIDNAALVTEESIGGEGGQQPLPPGDVTGPRDPPQGPQGGAGMELGSLTWMALGGALAAVGAVTLAWKLGWVGRKR